MNEELAILDFFSRTENLPLGLSVAEQMDEIRWQTNNRLWRELLPRINTLMNEHAPAWRVSLTEDRNAPDSLVGLHCSPDTGQQIYLSPMLEQQYLGDIWRIYLGMMWSTAPTARHLSMPEVSSLKTSLQKAGFKSSENFLAWQWTSFHPRRRDFLLRYAQQPEKLLDDIEEIFKALVITHRTAIEEANAALKIAPLGLAASLDQLRDELID